MSIIGATISPLGLDRLRGPNLKYRPICEQVNSHRTVKAIVWQMRWRALREECWFVVF
jgi:hypothetical protein